MDYDITIIGAGPAGLTAALYAAREGLNIAVVSKEIGGTASRISSIENWPGYNGPGKQLMDSFLEQLKPYKITFINEDVSNISKSRNKFKIQVGETTLVSKAVIIATGTDRRKLNIKGEKEFVGKGVSYCVTCDSFFFKNKTVAVIGGSDCAAISAISLADIAEKVYIVHRGVKLNCEDINSRRLNAKENVEFCYQSVPFEIQGKGKVESIIIYKEGKKIELKVDGIFIEIGATPLTELTKKLKLKFDKEGYIVVDKSMKTSIKGIFAAGDVTNFELKQVIVSSAQGAIAAKSAASYIRGK